MILAILVMIRLIPVMIPVMIQHHLQPLKEKQEKKLSHRISDGNYSLTGLVERKIHAVWEQLHTLETKMTEGGEDVKPLQTIPDLPRLASRNKFVSPRSKLYHPSLSEQSVSSLSYWKSSQSPIRQNTTKGCPRIPKIKKLCLEGTTV